MSKKSSLILALVLAFFLTLFHMSIDGDVRRSCNFESYGSVYNIEIKHGDFLNRIFEGENINGKNSLLSEKESVCYLPINLFYIYIFDFFIFSLIFSLVLIFINFVSKFLIKTIKNYANK